MEASALKNTVFLPQTPFPMRGNLPQKEPEILKLWETLREKEETPSDKTSGPLFVLHDGPPYANGHLHMGHALNKILKDIINRIHVMRGAHVVYIPGWDCHGLPIETKVEETYRTKGLSKKDVAPLTFRAACRDFAQKWLGIQREEFRRLGLMGDWENPYTTMSPVEEAGIVEAFLKIFMRGDVYRGVKPVLWSVVEETALAEAEVEYQEVQSQAIDVSFPITQSPHPELMNASAVIWTTTSWTLPGNRTIAYNAELVYTLIRVEESPQAFLKGKTFLVAETLLTSFCERTGIQSHTLLHTYPGSALMGVIAAHPLRGQGYDFPVPLLPGAHVTADTGTGLVHTAPSHGVEDFLVGQTFGLEIPETVGPSGLFEEHVPLFAGAHVYKVAPQVLEALRERGHLLSHHKLTHNYPHSWRSKTPLIYRATAQWFLAMDGKERIREKAYAAIQHVQWIPQSGQNRIQAMIEGRPDWCLSRQRVWGVPIPLFLHKKTGEPLRDERVNERILDRMAREGTDIWWSQDSSDFLEPFYKVTDFEKTWDVLDVWFDSGVTHEFVLPTRDLPYPSDLYLEGSDQHRGWFQSSLLTAIALGKEAPYKTVLTHGFVVDEVGRKMSKSTGNIMVPEEIVRTKGADILRLWVVASDFEGDMRVGPELLKHVEDLYRRIRNTFRYLLGALSNFSHADCVSFEEMPELEQWVYHRLSLFQETLRSAFETYHFHALLQEIHYFCTNDLSAFYFDVRKDSLYCDPSHHPIRRAAQTLMRDILMTLVTGLAPILVFTCEEVWQTMRQDLLSVFPDLPESVHAALLPAPQQKWKNPLLSEHYQKIRGVRQVITGALEQARAEKKIGSSLAAHPLVYIPSSLKESVSAETLEELSLTSGLSLLTEPVPIHAFQLEEQPEIGVVVELAKGNKCERCWKILPEVEPPQNICRRCEEVVGG